MSRWNHAAEIARIEKEVEQEYEKRKTEITEEDGIAVLRISREDPNQALDANLFADELIDRGDLVASFSADEPRLGEEQRHFVGALFRQFRLRSIEGPLYSLTFSFLEDPYILHFHLDTKEGKRGEAETEQSNFD